MLEIFKLILVDNKLNIIKIESTPTHCRDLVVFRFLCKAYYKRSTCSR